jgi:hypothetical protein
MELLRDKAVRTSLWLLLLVSPFACGEPLTVFDISRASAADVEQLKRLPGEAWWIEMGDQLVVVGGDAFAQRRATTAPTLTIRDQVDPHRLMLRARGCSEHSTERGLLLGQGGRWELRELAPDDLLALRGEDAHAWLPVTRNMTLARQFRLEPQGVPAEPDPAIQAVVDRIDAARWFADVQTLAAWDRSSYGTTSLTAARDWIAAQFTSLGLGVTLPAFQMNNAIGQPITRNNVVGAWVGSTQPERWVIVGAHYDSRNAIGSQVSGTPGAEDNATGCAGVIELARALLPSKPSHSMLFICYAGEEQGLRGSTAHVQAMNASGELANVDEVVIMDMIGYSADTELEALYESSASHSDFLLRFGAAAATYAPELAVITSTNPFGSDHVPYLNAGVRTALAIENDWDAYPHYHRNTDTAANIGPQAQAMGAAILKTNAAVIADLGLGGLPAEPFRDGFESPP